MTVTVAVAVVTIVSQRRNRRGSERVNSGENQPTFTGGSRSKKAFAYFKATKSFDARQAAISRTYVILLPLAKCFAE